MLSVVVTSHETRSGSCRYHVSAKSVNVVVIFMCT